MLCQLKKNTILFPWFLYLLTIITFIENINHKFIFLTENQGYNNPDDFAFIMSRHSSTGTHFTFEDQIEFPYYDWMPGQPDGNNDHIVIGGNSQKMDDVDSSEEHGFICEKFIQKHVVG